MRVFGQRPIHKHDRVNIWSELFHENDSESIWVGGSFKSMIVHVLGLRLFHEHDNENIWLEAFS